MRSNSVNLLLEQPPECSRPNAVFRQQSILLDNRQDWDGSDGMAGVLLPGGDNSLLEMCMKEDTVNIAFCVAYSEVMCCYLIFLVFAFNAICHVLISSFI